jgi:hypothetical protein
MSDFVVTQEEDAVPRRRLVIVAFFTVLVTLIGVFFSSLILDVEAGRLRPRALPAGAVPSSPGTTIGEVNQTMILYSQQGIVQRDTQRAELARYRWIDRDAGIAAIPIDRAIDIVVEKGR